ncbi:Aldo/keto reductase [Achaetomium macrosporum]|uniref:Aldo/keto reductase n=1 Tax=Achaetomium macrosporum TaxID=79813 RepID=A0AAN7C1P5_9PEZI|nr:Aldo/keto reductase [Achaetomium macrosporum]
MALNGLKIVFGGGSFFALSVEEVSQWLGILEELDIKTIDTAEIYGASEELLGKTGAAKRFTIDTKQPGGFGPLPATRDQVIKSGQASLQKLQTDAVDVYYLHAPDRRVPWKETLSGLNELHKQGAFKRLGLSNFTGQEVEEIVQVAKENNFVVPSVYQGNYNAVARRVEQEILPILRKHNIAFYAYSPIAGGFLSKTKAQLTDPNSRFGRDDGVGKLYNALYNRPSFVAALDTWEQTARDEGVSRAELAYRWVFYHSKLQSGFGDAVIVGASKQQQLRETVEAIKRGPLSDAAVKRIEELWESIKADAPLDNFEVTTQMGGLGK